MSDDVTVGGGKYAITFKDALSEDDDEITGDRANIMNMALARGCWFQWEYSVQMELHTGQVEDILDDLTLMRSLYAEVANWTPQQLQAPLSLTDSLNQLLRWGAGSGLTDQASSATLAGVGTFAWPPETSLSFGTAVMPIGSWDSVQQQPLAYPAGYILRSADGVYFRREGAGVVRIEPEQIQLTFDDPLVGGDADIAKARRELEAAIESKTQINQEKQTQLQDIAAALQRWFTFTTNVNERKKRDADTIAGNFH